MKAIELRNVSIWYEKNHSILEKVSISLKRGHIYGLLGINGSGKTTLLNTISGVRNSNFSGDIIINGLTLNNNSNAQLWHKSKLSRYVVTDYPMLFEEITAITYITFLHDLYQNKINLAELERLIEAFQFSEHSKKKIGELSLGNKQKVALIAGLLLQPNLFILDEPLVGLDVESIEVFYKELQEYKENDGTVLFSSHLLDIVQRFCDYILIVKNKTIETMLHVNSEASVYDKFFRVLHDE